MLSSHVTNLSLLLKYDFPSFPMTSNNSWTIVLSFFWVNHDHLPTLLDILGHLAAQLHLTVLDSAEEAVHQLQVLDPVLLQEEVEPLVEDAGEMLVLYRVDHLPLAALALVQVLQSLLGFSVAACCQYPQQGIQQTPVQIGESQSHGRWKMILLITLQCSNLFLY